MNIDDKRRSLRASVPRARAGSNPEAFSFSKRKPLGKEK